MKIRTLRYITKEGMLNTYRNKLMSLASIGIVAASLVIFGIFFLIVLNVSYNIKILKEQPEMTAFCFPEATDDEIAMVSDGIAKNPNVEKTTLVSKKEAFEQLKSMLGDNQKLLDDLDESFLPVKFVIKLRDPSISETTAKMLGQLPGVEEVQYPQQVISFIMNITHWIRVISAVLIAILLIISLFIIANTIKLTVFARRREINIMKYIGSTDWFIRWPFIIEGVIIGLFGALVAFVPVSYAYSTAQLKISSDLLRSGIDFIQLIKLKDIGFQVIGLYCIIGVIVGGLGSIISIRKHLHV